MMSKHTIHPKHIDLILDNSIICIFDSKFIVRYSSDNFNSLTGYKASELAGISISSLSNLKPDDATLKFIIETLENNETWKGELQLLHKNKQIIWVDTTIKPASDNSGKENYIAIFINITERKKLITNLKQRAHEQSLISILGQISLSNIPIKDLFDQILSVTCGSLEIESGAIVKLSKNKKTAFIHSRYNANLLSETVDIENILSFLLNNDHIISSDSLNNEKRFSVPDTLISNNYNNGIFILIGDKSNPFGIFVLLSIRPHLLNANETDFLTSICNILSQSVIRHNTENALKNEKELSNKYIDVADIMIIAIDINERIILANKKSEKSLGYNKNELTGLNFFDTFIPVDLRSDIRKTFHQTFLENTQNNNFLNLKNNIITMINRFNQKRTIKWNSSLIFDENNNISSILSAGEDITDILAYEKKQKRLEKKLHQAQKMEAIGIMTGGIAHDFNNILSSILGFSDLIKENIDSNDKILNEYIGYIQASGIKARDIIDQLQSINLNQSIADESALLPELLKGTLTMLRSIFPPDINISYNINENIPPVYMNSEKLSQLILQLLLSIRKSIPTNGSIDIELSKKAFYDSNCLFCDERIHGEYACISIHETGTCNSNIPADGTGKKSNDNDNSTEINTAAEIIHENNGHILIDQKRIDNDQGRYKTCIYSLFRIASDNKTHEKNIMIIDDENSVATYLGELLKGTGYKVAVFCDSTEALSSFKHQPDAYDLIITDEVMPAITGSELSTDILKIRPELPIILCTGHSDVINNSTPLSAGIRAYLKKPVNSERLLQLTASLLFNS